MYQPLLPRKSAPQVGVPRRFGIATMMIFTTIFAVLFAALKVFNVPPIAVACISIFVGGVAACQSLLFHGKNPRLASIVGGSVLLCVIMTIVGVTRFTSLKVLSVPCAGIGALFLGGPLGYGVGALVAAVFFIRKEPGNEPPKTGDHPPDLPPASTG